MREHPFRGYTRTSMREKIDEALLSEMDRKIAHACFVECCPSNIEAAAAAGCDRRTVARHLPHIIEILGR